MKDMRGVEIKLGDLIAMPFSKHSSGYLRVGRVVELVPSKQASWGGTTDEKLRVEWVIHKEYRPPSKSLITNFMHGLVLPDDFLDSLPERTDV